MGPIGSNLIAEVFCTTCLRTTTSLPGSTACNFCEEGYFKSGEDDGNVAKVKCTSCTEDGASCSETTTLGASTLTHGSASLATIRIKPDYWRLSARSTTLSLCLRSANGNSSCVGGNDAGDEDEFTAGYAGSGYCKKGHTGPLCQVCGASDFYFDSVEAKECIQCPSVSERLSLPLGIIALMLGLILVALVIKRFAVCHCLSLTLHLCVLALKFSARTFRIWGKRLRAMAAEVLWRLVTRFQQLEIMPKLKLLFT